ncbi:hypothetical protein NT6N_13760 [Oceaniferula spumae]|uniref:Uncharacterized protein n=1 Tax=Oceaniferula spumae TaxID=2979115 RepID=A0AAT9FJS7_9BACT
MSIQRKIASLAATGLCLTCAALAQSPLYPSLDASANSIGGNWKVVLDGGAENERYEAYVVMYPPLKKVKTELLSFSHDIYKSDPQGEWESEYLHDNIYDRGVKVTGNSMIFKHSSGIKGHWGAVSKLTFSGDSGKGTWDYQGRDSGRETWVRLRPKISKIEFGPLISASGDSIVKKPVVSTISPGDKVTVSGEYDEKSWGVGNRFPHARPKFYIRVYGENLWGFHRASVLGSAALRVGTGYPIYREGKSGFRNQIGATYIVSLWPGVSSGMQTFQLDHLKIPFTLDVKGLAKKKPESKTMARIGSVTLETKNQRERRYDASGAIAKQRSLVEEIERSIARQRADLATAETKYAAAAQREFERLKQVLKKEAGNPEQQANERRYSKIMLRNLSIQRDVIRAGLARELARLVPEQNRLAKLREVEAGVAAAIFPHFNGLHTKDARITSNKDIHDVIAEIDQQISEYATFMSEVAKARAAQRAVIIDAATAADKANNELRNAAIGSYIVQATAQAVVQIVDSAIASKGNPAAFIAIAGTQSIVNVTLSWPDFYDAKVDESGKVAVPAKDTNAQSVKPFVKSAATTIAKKGVSDLVEDYGKTAIRKSVKIAEERAALIAARKILGNTFAKIGKGMPVSEAPLVTDVIQGLAVDALTEKGKAAIAEEMQQEELLAYAQAQLNLAHAIRVLQDLGRIEDADAKVMATLRAERSRLLAGRPKELGTLAKIRPALEYEKNNKFAPVAGYEFVLEFADDVPPYDVYVNDVKLSPGTGANRFTMTQELVDSVGEETDVSLDVRISLR